MSKTQDREPPDRSDHARGSNLRHADDDADGDAESTGNRGLEITRVILMPLATVIATAIGGYFFSTLTAHREARESNDHLYAELLTQREQSDAQIRKDMFQVSLTRFLEGAAAQQRDRVLVLELLSSNFSDSLDLGPLFKEAARQLSAVSDLSHPEREALSSRLETAARDVITKQVSGLARRGCAARVQIPLESWTKISDPIMEIPGPDSDSSHQSIPSCTDEHILKQLKFTVELIDVNLAQGEVELRLRVSFPGTNRLELDNHFWVGQYTFPMLDNTQLPNGYRASIVMTDFHAPAAGQADADSFANLALVVFPAASGSFKDRSDFDEVLQEMLRNRESAASP